MCHAAHGEFRRGVARADAGHHLAAPLAIDDVGHEHPLPKRSGRDALKAGPPVLRTKPNPASSAKCH
jgi:hypothetical protein